MQQAHDQTWSTDHQSPAEAFTYWREAVHEAFLPLTLENRCEGRFSGRLTAHAVDAIRANRVHCGRHSVDRTRYDIARSTREYFYLLCPVAGRVTVRQYGREALLHPGECALAASDDPFVFDFRDDIDTLSVQIPLELLIGRGAAVRDAMAVNLARDTSVGPALTAFAHSLPANRLRGEVSGAVSLGATLLELVTLSAREASVGSETEGLSRRRIAAQSVVRYIEAHLCDPLLSPLRAARALGVSERTIHLVLRGEGRSFMAIVGERRLQRVARALETAHEQRRRISDIALEWGYADLSTFNRAFKKRFHVTPRDYARMHRSRGY